MARAFLGVIVGYAIFALSSALLFRYIGRFAVVSIVCGIVFAAVGGKVAALIGGEKGPAASLTLGAAIAIGAVIALVKGTGGMWSGLAAIFLMAPAAVGGGRLFRRRAQQRL